MSIRINGRYRDGYSNLGKHFNTFLLFSAAMSSVPNSNYKQYFLPGWNISRNIIFSHIHYFLGPNASVRPYSYQGREGYLLITPGPPLTEVSSSLVSGKMRPQALSNLSWQTEPDRGLADPVTAVRTASGGADDCKAMSAGRLRLHQSTGSSSATAQIRTK